MKNKKIIFIVLFAILFILLGCSKCFAVEYMPGTGVDEYKYYFILKLTEVDKTILFKVADTNFVVGHTSNQSTGTIFYFKNIAYNTYVLEDNNWVSFDISAYTNSGYSDVAFTPSSKISMMYSNFDISYDGYWKEQTGGDFFYLTLPGIVARQVESVVMSQVLQEIITLLPQILVVVVSLVGLRKGLKMLGTFLHQS